MLFATDGSGGSGGNTNTGGDTIDPKQPNPCRGRTVYKLYKSSASCETFIMCVPGEVMYEQPCGRGTTFNFNAQRCDTGPNCRQ